MNGMISSTTGIINIHSETVFNGNLPQAETRFATSKDPCMEGWWHWRLPAKERWAS